MKKTLLVGCVMRMAGAAMFAQGKAEAAPSASQQGGQVAIKLLMSEYHELGVCATDKPCYKPYAR